MSLRFLWLRVSLGFSSRHCLVVIRCWSLGASNVVSSPGVSAMLVCKEPKTTFKVNSVFQLLSCGSVAIAGKAVPRTKSCERPKNAWDRERKQKFSKKRKKKTAWIGRTFFTKVANISFRSNSNTA